jgi:hypothetical protein
VLTFQVVQTKTALPLPAYSDRQKVPWNLRQKLNKEYVNTALTTGQCRDMEAMRYRFHFPPLHQYKQFNMEPSMTKKNLPPEFIAQQIPRQGDIAGPLASRMVSVRLPVDIGALVYSVPEKSAWRQS